LRSTGIASGTGAGILLSDQADTVIRELPDSRDAFVRRAVVHDDDFEIPHCLGEDRVQRPRHSGLFIVEGNYYCHAIHEVDYCSVLQSATPACTAAALTRRKGQQHALDGTHEFPQYEVFFQQKLLQL
jgi:hypothetical protein